MLALLVLLDCVRLPILARVLETSRVTAQLLDVLTKMLQSLGSKARYFTSVSFGSLEPFLATSKMLTKPSSTLCKIDEWSRLRASLKLISSRFGQVSYLQPAGFRASSPRRMYTFRPATQTTYPIPLFAPGSPTVTPVTTHVKDRLVLFCFIVTRKKDKLERKTSMIYRDSSL